jgi:hypothetical protein
MAIQKAAKSNLPPQYNICDTQPLALTQPLLTVGIIESLGWPSNWLIEIN